LPDPQRNAAVALLDVLCRPAVQRSSRCSQS
jgi:hypothetical protein